MEEVRGMTEIDLSRAEWRKSSYSSQSGNCVEVALNLPGLVAVRDPKTSDRAKLIVSQEACEHFSRRTCLVTHRRNLPGNLSCTERHRCQPSGKTRPATSGPSSIRRALRDK